LTHRLYVILLLCFFSSAYSQPDNHWIDYNNQYFTFQLTEDKLYRITHQELQNARFPLSSVDPRKIILYAKGEQVPLYIQGESDGIFNATDYIEFYGERNDGWLDTALYGSRSAQPNPCYSLFNDSLTYYLSWSDSVTPLRYTVENNTNFGDYFAATYLWKHSVIYFNQSYYDGEILQGSATDPNYTAVEGWMNTSVSRGASQNISVSTPNLFTGGPLARVNIRFTGQSNFAPISNGDHEIRIKIDNFTSDTIFEGYQLIDWQEEVNTANLRSGNSLIQYQNINHCTSCTDRTAVAYASITYPHRTHLGNAAYLEFLLDDSFNQNGILVEVTSFNGGNSAVLYDLTNRKRIRVVQNFSSHRMIVLNGGGRKKLVLSAEGQQASVGSIQKFGTTGKFTDYSNNLTDSVFLIITHNSLYPNSTLYASYRESTGHSTLIALIGELYHQYAYGIRNHPLGIRNFIKHALADWTYPPSHLFLLGKSVSAFEMRKNDLARARDLVPTMGHPATDNLLTAGLGNTKFETALPTGRISATNGAEVDLYLNKLVAYETAPVAKWMKEGLHFAGGLSAGESNIYENYLNGYKQDFEGLHYGGNIRTFKKSSSAPIQITLADSIRNLINQGVSLMTFFGHASANEGFDISIDKPDQLNNRDKYPVMIANSCFTGNYHQPFNVSTGEDYVLEARKGAIAYVATGNLGLPFYLNQYSSNLYENFTKSGYGKSLAENMRLTVQELQSGNVSGPLKFVCLEMALQGDPALVINYLTSPDYRITADNAIINPSRVTTELDSFQLNLTVENVGKAVTDSVELLVQRNFPGTGRKDTFYFRKIPRLYYEQVEVISLEVDRINGVGENQFSVIVDPNNLIPELDENNNRIDFSLQITTGEVVPVYPFEFSMVGAQAPVLKASTVSAFEKERQYRWQLDTTLSFNSPSLAQHSMSSAGGVLEWQPALLSIMPDSAVYFWRVSKTPLPGEDFNWRGSSFQYLAGESGWSQAHPDQYRLNEFLFMQPQTTSQPSRFVDNIKELYVFTRGTETSLNTAQGTEVRYAVDADVRERNACGTTPGFLIAVLDSLTLESWQTPYNGANANRDYGQANKNLYCGTSRQRSESYFLFRQSVDTQMTSMRDFLLNEVPDGNYVVVYSWQGVDYSQIWQQDSSILQAFASLGSKLITSVQDNHPFIFTVRKGDLSTVREIKGDSANQGIDMKRELRTSADFGSVTSVNLKPRDSIRRLAYKFIPQEIGNDSIILSMIKQVQGGSNTLITTKFLQHDTSLQITNNPSLQGDLKLEARLFDEVSRTPPNFDYWMVNYNELPDVAFAPNQFLDTNGSRLTAGENLRFGIGIRNTAGVDIDSSLLSYSLLKNNRLVQKFQKKIAGIKADSLLQQYVEVATEALSGRYEVLLELNADQQIKEYHRFNNFASLGFSVATDQTDPFLQVTFDGRRIMNREMVSARPLITISLTDENGFRQLDDTSSFNIYLRKPNGQEELVSFANNERLQFIPATAEANEARVVYRPVLEEDGFYRLRIQAKDKSGNTSGEDDYAIEFEVVNRSTISNLLTYPNPFSTSTRFVFTLTGSQLPDNMLIQIMTVTGKVVKEIQQAELGPLHIGTNMTEYAWDGRDDFGDQLANGVYLFRVKTKLNGSSIEHRQSEADQFFKAGFGKIYLMR
jgi:hypothetical protein